MVMGINGPASPAAPHPHFPNPASYLNQPLLVNYQLFGFTWVDQPTSTNSWYVGCLCGTLPYLTIFPVCTGSGDSRYTSAPPSGQQVVQ
jgi:hypothetical protein